jgi:DNA-binding transcriptional MerR regulator/quercetin dioxygenase-like cupin family protein
MNVRTAKQRSGSNDGKLRFLISDVAGMLNVSPSTIRLWESMGLVLPERTVGGRRYYAPEQVERLKLIHRLREENKLNLEAIRQLLGANGSLGKNGNGYSPAGPISRQLRKLRQRRGMTLAAAAEGTGLSVSFLSSLERGQVNASLATLQKLSVFYETNVLSFFGNTKKPRKLVCPKDRRQLSNEPGVHIELLSLGTHMMEPHLYRLAPGTSSGGSYHHQGEEFIYVLSGCCELWLDEVEHYRIEKGDSLYFSSTQAHRWSVPGDQEAVLLWINTPPTF